MSYFYPTITKYFPILLLVVLCGACGPVGRLYNYNISMRQPNSAQNLRFENDTLAITFSFKPKYIGFELYNKLNEGIKLNWEDVSMSVNGTTKRIAHYDPFFNKYPLSQSITVPPNSKINDRIVSTDQYYYNLQGEYSGIIDVFPGTDHGYKGRREYIQNLKGRRITVYIPYYIKNEFHSKTFEFIVDDVISTQ